MRRPMTLHQQDRKQSPQPNFSQPLPIHPLSIFAHTKEEEDQKATSEINPSIIEDSRRQNYRCIPSLWIVELAEIEWVVLAWVVGSDDPNLEGCDAEDEGRGCGEEAEEAAACCVAAGEDGVEGRAVSVETDNDEDCKEGNMVRSSLRMGMDMSTYPHSIERWHWR
jgi:hypothetical protein